jgi:hypothetical protein
MRSLTLSCPVHASELDTVTFSAGSAMLTITSLPTSTAPRLVLSRCVTKTPICARLGHNAALLPWDQKIAGVSSCLLQSRGNRSI